ncbi:MAG: hypothetical protein CME82_04765 [Halomonas sp.]|nr:hypothetical protein [Halomonas sp.]
MFPMLDQLFVHVFFIIHAKHFWKIHTLPRPPNALIKERVCRMRKLIELLPHVKNPFFLELQLFNLFIFMKDY